MNRALLLAGATCALLAGAAPAEAARPLDVDVRIQKFRLQGTELTAKGVARAGLRDAGGTLSTATKPVTFQVKGGGASCRVLTLKLDTLKLTLLGLRVDTSPINLLITGRRSGGALGQLFCRLARGLRLNNRALARNAVRTLNKRVGRRPMRAIAFRARVEPSDRPAESPPKAKAAQDAPPPGSCQVLDLILGPLNLDLLGLRVDLYGATSTQPVRVLITADPNGGVLGQVFCRLARGEGQQQQA
jgi:hypothetical protein